jgi:energy-coupling factor transport system permease protein
MAFFENITIGQYVPRDSLIHNLDPRTKILLIFSWLIIAAITVNIKIYLFLLFSIFLVFFLSNLSFSFLFKNLKSFIWLFVLIFILQIFFTSGTLEILYHFGFIYIPGQSISNGIVYSLRLAIFVLGALILSLTTSPVDLTDATFKFFSFLKKFKLPVEELNLVTMISLRFVPLLLEEAVNLKKAQLARGASFDGGIFQRTKKSIPLLLPLFISSFRKADELALALDARGFLSGQKRSSFQKLKFKKNDYICLGLLIILIFVCLWIKKA